MTKCSECRYYDPNFMQHGRVRIDWCKWYRRRIHKTFIRGDNECPKFDRKIPDVKAMLATPLTPIKVPVVVEKEPQPVPSRAEAREITQDFKPITNEQNKLRDTLRSTNGESIMNKVKPPVPQMKVTPKKPRQRRRPKDSKKKLGKQE